jgi:LPXTG-site transpeptidase (sortase) family protein
MHNKSQVKFALYFLGTFIVLFVLLYSAGLVPESIKTNQGDSFRVLWDKAQKRAIENQTNQGVALGENPTRIVIDKIGVDATVSNPNTTNVTTLDEYLKNGAVRYPSSGLLGMGNMYIFGHSTSIAIVHNQAYKTFNGLKDLKKGDSIKVYGASKIYKYIVTSVTLVDENKALVEFGNNKNMLTLSTCNTFGAKGERYVIEADYAGIL